MSDQENGSLHISSEDLIKAFEEGGISETEFKGQQIPIVDTKAIERGKNMKVKESDQGLSQGELDDLIKLLPKE